MPQVFYGFFIVETDLAAPVVSNRVPAPNSLELPLNTNVSFDVTDQALGAGISSADLYVTFNSTPIITAGVFQSGYSGTLTPFANGYSVFINPNSDFTVNDTINVQIIAQDQALTPNVVIDTYTISVLTDNTAPSLSNNTPVGIAVLINTPVTFDLTDPGYNGVKLASVVVRINGTIVYQNETPLLGYTVVTTPIALGYHYAVTPPAPWPVATTIEVKVDATDTHP